MKKLFLLSLLFSLVFISCNDEPEPEPEVIRAYCYMYHFIPELADVILEIDDAVLPENPFYGVQYSGGVILEDNSEEISFTVKHSGTQEVLVSQLHQLEKDKNYNVFIGGSSDDPIMYIWEIDGTHPPSGHVKFQVMHSIAGQGPIDVYMGDTTIESRGVSELPYLNLSSPFTDQDYNVRASIIVSAHSDVFVQDSVLLSSAFNDMIITGANYMSVVAPHTFNPESDLTFYLFEMPLE